MNNFPPLPEIKYSARYFIVALSWKFPFVRIRKSGAVIFATDFMDPTGAVIFTVKP
jgi:hypothetical protein